MGFDFSDRFETMDGSRPSTAPLADRHAEGLSLNAFALLRGGDVLEGGSSPPPQALTKLRAYIASHIRIMPDTVPGELSTRIKADVEKQLAGNPGLAARLCLAKPIRIDVVPPGGSLTAAGFPAVIAERAAGVFWDQPKWEQARIGLRHDHLVDDKALVFHEMAHALFYLALSRAEQNLVYDPRPSFGSRAAMDEVFAIYTEQEFAGAFGDRELKAPGIYGYVRRQWSEDHVFTRFVRKLYFPARAPAGPGMRPIKDGAWMTKLPR